MKKLLFLLVIAAMYWAYSRVFGARTYPPGVLVKNDPVQVLVDSPMAPIKKGDFVLHPLARYTIDARILHTKHYYDGEPASLVPYDIAVGWGPMSDQKILDQLDLSQGNRFFFFEYQNQPPIPKDEIICHSSNMHLIASSSKIAHRIAWLRVGDVVRLRGLLVEATNTRQPEMRPWRSSLSRTDTGNGACELMWVESIAEY